MKITKKKKRELKRELSNYSVKELKEIIIKLTPTENASSKYILERDNYQCRLCGRTEKLNVHHITPRCLGGTRHEYNLIILCKLCHIFIHCNPMEKINKSDLIKTNMIKINGDTFSKKGKKWGRPKLGNVDDKIIKLHKNGKSYREICKEVFYWNCNNHKKFVSMGYVHKLLVDKKENIEEENNENVSKNKVH